MKRLSSLLAAAAVCAAVTALPAPAHAQAEGSAPDLGRPFEPAPQSKPLYGIRPPEADPATQRIYLEAHDGVDLWVETWLPEELNGNVPPARIPTVLVMTPYVGEGQPAYSDAIGYFVPRGYAVAQHHVRGTGNSGGCIEETGPKQIDDGARVVRYLGRDAPWSDGKIGMYGISYDAEAQISVAGLGDPKMTKYLKAIVPASSVGGQYEYSFFDGVPYATQGPITWAAYLLTSALTSQDAPPGHFAERAGCQPQKLLSQSDLSGDMTEFWQVREYRPGAPNIRAATLMVHGLADWNVKPLTEAGLFDRIPASTPHKAVLGVWGHAFPHERDLRPQWARPDWFPMTLAWYDRYLKRLNTGVESWPPVQVQGNDGQWRAEPDWAATGGPVGQLALGPDGALGLSEPSGSTSYTEGGTESPVDQPGSYVQFTTDPLPGRLEITGQPALDLWVSLSQPDAHLAVKLETFDEHGGAIEAGRGYGFRSARHLEPLDHNRFAQEEGKPAPTGEPLHVLLRFHPGDLVIPKGGTLRLTIAGSVNLEGIAGFTEFGQVRFSPTVPSGSLTEVTILHDCDHPSVFRFLMPRRHPDLLNIREIDEPGLLEEVEGRVPSSDGGALATDPVCGAKPKRLEVFGPKIAYGPPELERPLVKINLSDRTPRRGEKLRIKGFLRACKGHAGTSLQLWRKVDSGFEQIASKTLNDRCRARFKTRASFKEAVFKTVWPQQDDDHRMGHSDPRRVSTHR